MKQGYFDIIHRMISGPLWWDEVGCPRYDSFDPDLANNIYAHEVVLLNIACQGCGRMFLVCMSWDSSSAGKSLKDRIASGGIHYGDPPNRGCCVGGATINSECHRVVEFWERRGEFQWVRDRRFEISLIP